MSELEYPIPKTHETLHILEVKQGSGEKDQTEYLNQRLISLEELKEKMAQNSSLLNDDEINHIIGEIEEGGNSFGVMRDILEHVLSQTNYLHDWVESGVVQDLIDANLDTPFTDRPITVQWGKKNMKTKGHAFDLRDEVGIKEEIPTPAQILESLAIEGRFPLSFRIFGHEIIHTYQSVNAGKSLQPNGMFAYIKERVLPYYQTFYRGKPIELGEVQARRQSDKPPETHSPDDVFDRIEGARYTKTRKHGYKISEDKLTAAISMIDRLNALGLSVEELGQLTHDHGGWDKKSKTYKGLEKRLKHEMDERNLKEEDVDKLLRIDVLERSIERQKVMRLVQEELQKEKMKNQISSEE